MGMIEDIMKALERIPVWKRVSGLPEQVATLEQRIAALEQRLAGSSGTLCPMCNAPQFKRVSSVRDAHFGFAGVMLDTFECQACHHREDRQRETTQL